MTFLGERSGEWRAEEPSSDDVRLTKVLQSRRSYFSNYPFSTALSRP